MCPLCQSLTSDGCRDARSVRPLCQRLQRLGFNGNGRTDRASLQRVIRPPRNEKILRNFDMLLPRFHFILPNFYFVPPWGISVCSLEIPHFLGRDRKLDTCGAVISCDGRERQFAQLEILSYICRSKTPIGDLAACS